MSEITKENTCPAPEPFRENIGIILFLTLLFCISFLSRFIFAPLMPQIQKDLMITHSQAGSLFLVLSVGFMAAQLGSGFVASRILHRGAIITSALGIGLFLLPLSFLDSLNSIRIVLFLLGMAAGFHLPSALATITALVDRQDWGKALGLHQTAPSSALILGPFMVVALPFSWRILLLLVGLFSLAAGIAFCFTKGEGHFPGQPPNPDNVKDVFSLKSFWIMVILFSMGIGSSAGLYTMIPLYLSTERGFDPENANFLLGLSRISGLFMAFASGWISDCIGPKKTIAGVLFFSGAATIVLGLASHDWAVIALFVQPLIATCFFPPAFSTLSGIVRPALRSLATSLAVPIGFLTGGGLVPMFLGEMGMHGSFGAGIAILGVCIMAVPFLTVFLVLRDSDGADEGC